MRVHVWYLFSTVSMSGNYLVVTPWTPDTCSYRVLNRMKVHLTSYDYCFHFDISSYNNTNSIDAACAEF